MARADTSGATNLGAPAVANIFGIPASVTDKGLKVGSLGVVGAEEGPQPIPGLGGFGLGTSDFGGFGGGFTFPTNVDPATLASGVSPSLAGVESAPGFRFAPNILDFNAFAAIGDFLRNPIGLTGAGQGALDFANSGVGAQNIQQFLGLLPDAFSNLREGLNTGFRVDLDPIRQAALRQFENQTIPGIAEQFAGTTGVNSSDFGRALAGSAADINIDLGALQVGADEAAAARRTQFGRFAPGAGIQLAGGATALATEQAAFDAFLRGQLESIRPGSRLKDFFSELLSFDPGSAATVGGGGGGGTAEIIAAALSATGSLGLGAGLAAGG